jgi:hypothetical protein
VKIQGLPKAVLAKVPWFHAALLNLYPPDEAPALVNAVLSAMLFEPDGAPRFGSSRFQARDWLATRASDAHLAALRRHATGELAAFLETQLAYRIDESNLTRHRRVASGAAWTHRTARERQCSTDSIGTC